MGCTNMEMDCAKYHIARRIVVPSLGTVDAYSFNSGASSYCFSVIMQISFAIWKFRN